MKKGVKSGTKQETAKTAAKHSGKAPADGDAADETADDGLWQFVTRSIKPLSKKRRPIGKPAPAKGKAAAPAPTTGTPKAAKGEPKADRPFAHYKPAIPHTPVMPKAPPALQGFDRATETKLKKGKLELEGRIDLHGMTQNEAHAALGRFIRASVRQEKRTVLVITGKGRVGGGTLRRAVPLWLEDPEFRKMVIASTPAQQKDGGDGALYVRLRRQRD